MVIAGLDVGMLPPLVKAGDDNPIGLGLNGRLESEAVSSAVGSIEVLAYGTAIVPGS